MSNGGHWSCQIPGELQEAPCFCQFCSVVNNIISGPCVWCLDSGFEPLRKIKLPLIEKRGLFSEMSGIPLFLWTIGRCWSKEISPSNKGNFCWKKKKVTPDIPSSLWHSGEPQITTGSHMSGSYYVLGGQGPGNS